MNTVQLTGRLTAEPELRALPDGTPACKIRLAVREMGRGREIGYVDATEYGAGGIAAAHHLSKGWLVAVSGRLKYRQWETAKADKRHDYEIVGHIEFLAAPRNQDAPAGELDQELAAVA
ncbi:MAG TPA: single-stranded DNA-binding protein [Solirubrobacteraceae bacterium]|nr:single-stranded DNA-binding protein [Solirubrobacteraceae bacterium]